jgi:hypothetical protein
MVIEIISSHSYRLDILLVIHDIFYIRLLKPAIINPLPGQVLHEL